MHKIFTSFGKAIAFTLMLLVCSFSNAATYYFSSSSGDDARSSAQAQNQSTPWRSIQKLNSIFATLQPGDNILFKNGDTFQGTISITKSGTAGAPISFGSYGSGEKPVLTGFREIKDWVSKGGNLYEASIPEVTTAVSTVVMDNVLQAMGRYPNNNAANSGYLTINSFSGGTIGSSGLQAPASMAGGEIVIRKNNWIIDRHFINWQSGTSVNYNPAGSSYSPKIGFGFFIQNHPATLDKHGEWYYNKATKKMLIFYQGNPAGANIRVSTVDRVINILNSASHIRFSNLTIQGSNENLINLNNSSNFTIENCLLEYVGKNAINSWYSKNLTISNSQISNALNGGINLERDDRGIVVRNSTFNKIHAMAGMGQSADSQGNGIFMSETTSDVLIEYSTFLESGYNAVYFDGNNITVRNNLIDTFCFVKDDGGGIYTFTGPKNTTFANRKITNNIIVNGIGAVHGTKPYGPTDFPYVEGIYLDLFANGIEIDGNTIGNVKSKGIFVNNCRNVSITNNKIFNTGYSIFITSDYTDNLTRNITMKNNEFLNKDSNQLHMYVRSKVNTLGQMGTFDSNVYSRPVSESNAFNLQTPGKNGLIDLQAWKDSYGLDKISTKSPIVYDKNKMGIDEFILFDYNYSNSAKSLPLSGTYVDLKGKILSGSVSVPAYSSVLLLKSAAGAPIANVPPTVSISAPAASAQFIQGDNISITANAADSDGTIAKVDFYNGTTLLGTDTTSPYSFAWANLPVGSFALTAKATDNKGTATVSAVVNINVGEKGNEAPAVSISSPSQNASFEPGNNITITANAANPDGTIAKVDFYNGTTLLGTDTSSPYSFSWTNAPVGILSLTAKATDDKGNATVSAVINISVVEKTSRSPYGGTTATIPGTVEAENYDVGGQGMTYYDVNEGNTGGVYRTDDVDIHAAVEGGYTVAWMNPNEWLEYTVNITTAGAYNLDARVASPGEGGTFHIECDGIDVTGPLTVPATGGWDSWTSVKKTGVNLPAGTHVLRYVLDSYGVNAYWGNLNSMTFNIANVAPTVSITGPTANAQFIQGENISITSAAADSDGTIAKVEFYNGNTLLGTDTTSPYSFAWTNLPLGNFTLTAKATDDKGAATVSAPVAINVVEKTSRSPYGGAAATIPGTVEAENYDVGGKGVTYHDVDAGNKGGVYRADDVDINAAVEGGYTLAWMKLNEWLEYTVNITTAGAYTLDARVASPGAGGTFHIECNGVDVTGPLTVPATGGWDTWTSVKKTGVNLPAGTHVLRYVLDSYGVNGYWGNLNSMNFSLSNLAPTVSITAPAANAQFIQGDNISITSVAADSDGTISKVDFFHGTTLLGTDTSSPYSFAWTNLPVGSFSLTAKATDDKGTATVSAPVAINVVEKANFPPGPISGTGLLEGLVAFYEMNTNVSGALRDSHGQNHGTSKLISHVNGFNDKGNKYNGTSSISSVPHSNGLILTTEFTLMADIFREGNGQQFGSNIVGKTLSTQWSANHAYSISITPDNKIRIRTNIPSLQDWVSAQTVPLGKWVRIIATYKSGEGYSLYFDSTVPEKSQPISGTIYRSVSELTIGGASSQAGAAQSRWFQGILDNVGIWNRKLSPEEISDLITNKITYPDFKGKEVYRVLMTSVVDEIPGKITDSSGLTKAEPGEKLVFFIEEGEDDVVFDHWSIDGVQASDQTIFELEMPEKDISLTKHFRSFVAPEIKIVLPDQQSEFEALSEVHIELQTKRNDAEIEKIELFNGENLVGELTKDSTGLDWKNIPEGNHQLVARITDKNGKSYFSDPVILKAVDYQSKDIPGVLLEYAIGPNPTTDYLNVIFKNLDGIYDFEFRIVSMNGTVQKTFTARPLESTVTIDVSDLQTGTYVIHLMANGKNHSSKKFIKLK